MPTIIVKKDDLETLLGKKLLLDELESFLPWVKGELKEFDQKTDEIKIELNDSNRPDLWCTEGIVRQIKLKLTDSPPKYPFYKQVKNKQTLKIIVQEGVQPIRPYIAAFGVSNFIMTEEALVQFIQTQEKLAEVFGQKRKLLSIGIYHLDPVEFPLIYKSVPPEEAKFIPLGCEHEMTLKEILEVHPKGKVYRHVFKSEEEVPLFIDRKGTILSFPPIINSREVGEVKPGNQNLLVEITGTELRLVNLVLNILATNLFDRGAKILPASVSYPYKTSLGKEITFPYKIESPLNIQVKEIKQTLGEPIKGKKLKNALTSYGHTVMGTEQTLTVIPPPYRDDLIHYVDVIEDVAISLGYHSFRPEMPTEFTIGSLSKIENFSDALRDYFIGFGFQEIISNILSSREDLIRKMNLDNDVPLVEIENVMTAQFSVVRNSILPSLLKVEFTSGRAFYPHKIFEIGEIARKDKEQNLGSKTQIELSALIAHPSASFSEMHSFLEALYYYVLSSKNSSYELRSVADPAFMSGRCGEVFYKKDNDKSEKKVGMIGEIAPQVLDLWQIGIPCVFLTLHVDELLD